MYTWARRAPNSFECSSKGHKEYSAFYARLPDGRTIEEHYQCDVKGYDPKGTNWRLGKGKPPIEPMTQEAQYIKYRNLWVIYFKRNPYLLERIKETGITVITYCFASTPINQAIAIADVLNESIQDK